MKKEKLSDAIGKLDEDIIEEADKVRQAAANGKPVKKRSPIMIATSVLVAAAAAVTGVVVIPRLGNSDIPTTEVTTAVTDANGAEPTDELNILSSAIADEEDAHLNDDIRARRRSGIVSDVSAVNTSGDNIAADSGFLLTLAGDVSEEKLRNSIKLTPASEFTLTRESGSSYLLKTAESFADGTLVKLAVEDDDGEICDSWAFRTADKFGVLSTYPTDGASGVNADTGIEIEMSDSPDITNIDKYFEISPAVTGQFDKFNGMLYFVPDKPLAANTVYTVTLKEGYPSASGDTLDEDSTFSFRTTAYGADGTYMFTISSNSGFSEAFLPDDRACVEIECSENLRKAPFETHLYRFTDTEDYLAAIEGKSRAQWADEYTIDTSGLTEVFNSGEVPFSRDSDSSSVYVLLPEQLYKGCYVADISADIEGMPSFSLQYLVQVTDLSVYSLTLGDECIFYINDSATGLPVSGASVTLETNGGTYSSASDDKGIAYVKTNGETGKAALSITSDVGTYIDSYILSDAENVKYDDEYYTYLYTDRAAYLPTDTVRVWGVMLPKTRGTALPSDLYLQFDSETKRVTPAADGTFSAEFTYKNHRSGWGNRINLMCGEDVLTSTSFVVLDYNKPTYVLDLDTPDYVIMPQVNGVPVTATVSYFEGTPAENVLLKSSEPYDTDETPVLAADINGEVKTTLICWEPYSTNGWSSYQLSFSVTGIEDNYAYEWKNIPALYHDRYIEHDFDKASNTLTLHTYDLDFSRADEFFKSISYDGMYYSGGDMDIIKGAPADIPVHVKIERWWNEPRETGSYYDAIEKKTVKLYEYDYNRATVFDETVTTVNGECVLPQLPLDLPGTYFVSLTFTDSLGYEIEENFYAHDTSDWFYISADEGYDMAYSKDSEKLAFRLDAGSEEYGDTSYFSENGDITFTLKCSNGKEDFDGKLFLTVYRSDLVTYEVYDLNGTNKITYRAGRDCIPNANYTAAYFDGKHIYKAYGSSIVFDPTERGITLDVSSDGKTYDAGDTAVITVKASDANGKALADATVLLSVVDEAAFAVADQNADPLHELYRYIWYPNAKTYVSYIQHLASSTTGGEKGGGDPEGPRKDFKDTAFFASAVTDKDGNAVFSVKLPDNMTTWRATVLAVSTNDKSDVLAGTSKLPIVVTRPLFITPIMHDEFVEGDDVAVSAKCAGLGGGTMTVTLTGDGINETRTIKQQETANFGKLPIGSYTVTFTAEKDGYTDAVEMPLTVTDTLLETFITKNCDLNELAESTKPTKWPLDAAFFNKSYMFRTDVLYSLLGYCGDDLGSRMACEYAALQLGYITEDEFIAEFAGEAENDFAKPLPAAETSQSLSALISVLAPETIGKECARLLEKYTNTDNYSEAEVCRSYMALAALGEPVMHNVKALLTANEDIYPSDGVFLAAALALCGDYGAAYDAYIRFVPDITVNDTDPNAIFAYIGDTDGKLALERTKAALIPAAVLGLPEAEYFARYLSSDDDRSVSKALELAIFLDRYIPENEEDAVFTYTMGGETRTVTLDRHHPTFLTFTEEQFANADFKVQSGEVYVIAGYTGRVNENSTPPTAAITKTLSGSTDVGSEITVTIKTVPYSIVYDVVPSCGRLSGSSDGQLVTLWSGSSGTVTYKFTVNIAGEYVVESAVVYDGDDNRGISERSTLTVGNANENA